VAAADSATTNGGVTEQGPRLIYAPDAEGNPVPLINVPLATVQRLLDQQQGLLVAQQPPAFQIDRLTIHGVVRERLAELEVEMEVSVLRPLEGEASTWTPIPLRFHDASLLAPPEYVGDGRLHLGFDVQQGYQAWLHHERPGDHRLKLKLAVPLASTADSTQLRFFPPLANQSQLEMQLPGDGILAELENALDVTVQPGAAGLTIVRAHDLRNQVVLSWRQGEPAGREPPTYLDVRGDIRVTIDGPGAIRSNAGLDLQSYGRPIEQVRLRLPPYTKVVSGNQPGYTISELAASGSDGDQSRGTVQIKLEKPATQARIQLVTQTTDQAAALSSVDVASFEVVGAIRQSGRVSLLTSEEWLVYWTLGPSVRRAQQQESAETAQERRLLASFQYFGQPCRLDVQIQPQGTRVGVEPNYRMRVDKDRVSLEVVLNYKIRGAPSSFLNFALNGWELDDVGPGGAVENDDVRAAGADPIKLRLTKATSGDLALTLNLHRPLQGSQGTLRFPLPWPAADTVAPGTLLVVAADSLVLNYLLQEMTGLVQDPLLAAAATPTAGAGQTPTAFRLMTDRALGEVVIDYEIRGQALRVRMDTVMELTADAAQVSQRMAYRIQYEPASRLPLEVPQALFDLLANPRFRNLVDLRVDGQSLSADGYQEMVDESDDARDRALVPLNVPLERASLGTVNVELRFAWPLPGPGSGEFTEVPLATPRDAEVTANTATLTAASPLRVEPSDDGNWQRDNDVVPGSSLQAVGMAHPRRPNGLRLRVAQRQDENNGQASGGATVVDRAWLQTWVADDQRLDRAVFRLVSGAPMVQVKLPAGIEQVLTLVDGQEVEPTAGKTELVVPLPRGPGNEHTLELSLRYGARPQVGLMQFEAPALRDASSARRWFWQLLVPADEHLLAAGQGLTSANAWTRRGWFWRRQAAQPQSWLEDWTGATHQPALPPGLNQYLFSSFDRMDRLQVRTCSRQLLVYSSSALALALGLGLLYWPALRHPAVVLLLAVTLASTAWLFADVALLVSQAAALGVALALLAALVSLVLRQFQRDAAWSRGMGPSAADSRVAATPSWSVGAAPQSTTLSAPASAPAPAPAPTPAPAPATTPAPAAAALAPDSKA
jgi:hypothetical protein